MLQASKCIKLVFLCVLCLSFLSCAPKQKSQPSVWPKNANVQWLDSEMQSKLDILSLDVAENKSGLYTFYIQGKNLSSRPVYFAYRVDWFAESGRRISGGTSNLWKHKEILGNDMVYIRDVAPNANAVSAQIVIRKVDRNSSKPQQQTKEQ